MGKIHSSGLPRLNIKCQRGADVGRGCRMWTERVKRLSQWKLTTWGELGELAQARRGRGVEREGLRI